MGVSLRLLGVLIASALLSCDGELSSSTGSAQPAGNEQGMGVSGSVAREEGRAERLATVLRTFSIALQHGDSAGAFELAVGEQLTATLFPSGPPRLTGSHKWIRQGQWIIGEQAQRTRAELAASWDDFAEQLLWIESVKTKVASTHTQGADTQASLVLAIVGADVHGAKQWIRGTASAAIAADGKLAGFRLESLTSIGAQRPLFDEVGEVVGFPLPPGDEQRAFYSPYGGAYSPAGAAVADLDGNGFVDLLVVGGQPRHTVYLNHGNGDFRDAGVLGDLGAESEQARFQWGPVFLDYDNDGDSDVFMTGRHQVLMENRMIPDGTLSFRDVTERAGLKLVATAFSAAVGDVNGDGYPDIYIAHYSYDFPLLNRTRLVDGNPNFLFINQQDGTFVERAAAWGVKDDRLSLAAQFADVDGDVDLDLFVTNDMGGGSELFFNHGNRFEAGSGPYGIVDPNYGMGVSIGDYDNDGDFDVHVTNMSSTAGKRVLELASKELQSTGWLARGKSQTEGNALYRNDGQGRFTQVAHQAGPFEAGWAWGGGFVDFDNDGWLDLHAPNGYFSMSTTEDT